MGSHPHQTLGSESVHTALLGLVEPQRHIHIINDTAVRSYGPEAPWLPKDLRVLHNCLPTFPSPGLAHHYSAESESRCIYFWQILQSPFSPSSVISLQDTQLHLRPHTHRLGPVTRSSSSNTVSLRAHSPGHNTGHATERSDNPVIRTAGSVDFARVNTFVRDSFCQKRYGFSYSSSTSKPDILWFSNLQSRLLFCSHGLPTSDTAIPATNIQSFEFYAGTI